MNINKSKEILKKVIDKMERPMCFAQWSEDEPYHTGMYCNSSGCPELSDAAAELSGLGLDQQSSSYDDVNQACTFTVRKLVTPTMDTAIVDMVLESNSNFSLLYNGASGCG